MTVDDAAVGAGGIGGTGFGVGSGIVGGSGGIGFGCGQGFGDFGISLTAGIDVGFITSACVEVQGERRQQEQNRRNDDPTRPVETKLSRRSRRRWLRQDR